MATILWRAALLGAFVGGVLAGPSLAQTSDAGPMSAEEISERFNQQQQARTRGLVLAPSSQPATGGTTDASTTVEPLDQVVELPREQQVFVNISFDFDSALLKEDQKPRLTNLCTAIKASDLEAFRIVGHTDSSGSDEYNDRLSLLRAEEVKRYMVNECGIAADRLETVGVGERFPYNTEDTRSDENRRVEFQVVG